MNNSSRHGNNVIEEHEGNHTSMIHELDKEPNPAEAHLRTNESSIAGEHRDMNAQAPNTPLHTPVRAIFFTGVAQAVILTLIGSAFAVMGIYQEANSLSSFLGAVFLYGCLALVLLSILNIIFTILYFVRRSSISGSLILPTMSFILSLVVVTVAAYIVVFAISFGNNVEESLRRGALDDKLSREVSVGEAKDLLFKCDVEDVFYHTDESINNYPQTGIYLRYFDNEPNGLSLSNKMVDEIVPIALEAQKKCDSLRIMRDGQTISPNKVGI